mmetsp:Transcript_93390/g.253392  ORF Transcript_93390/g.253392 Transcript_93390/m.253392 type:complete len:325 (+) Transcript_93390:354-1328(+)
MRNEGFGKTREPQSRLDVLQRGLGSLDDRMALLLAELPVDAVAECDVHLYRLHPLVARDLAPLGVEKELAIRLAGERLLLRVLPLPAALGPDPEDVGVRAREDLCAVHDEADAALRLALLLDLGLVPPHEMPVSQDAQPRLFPLVEQRPQKVRALLLNGALEVGADRLAQLPPTGVRVLLVEYLLEGRALILKSVLVHRKHEVLLREGSCPVQPDHGACGQRRAQVLQRLLGRHAVRDEDDLCADHYSEHIDEGADVCHGVVAPLAIQYDQVLAGRHVLDPRQATGLQQLSHGHRHDVDALGDGLRGVARLEGVLGTNDAGAKV